MKLAIRPSYPTVKFAGGAGVRPTLYCPGFAPRSSCASCRLHVGTSQPQIASFLRRPALVFVVAGSGGGLHADGNLLIPGTADFKGCAAFDGGGGAAAHSVNISGTCHYRNCLADGQSGGGGARQELQADRTDSCMYCTLAGMRLHGNFLQVGGRSLFKRCRATRGPGGGLHINGTLEHRAGELEVDTCTASAGGGIFVKQHVSLESVMSVSRCRAASGGRNIFCNVSLLLDHITYWMLSTGW